MTRASPSEKKKTKAKAVKTKAKLEIKKVSKSRKKANGAAPIDVIPAANEAQPDNRPKIKVYAGEHSSVVNLTEDMLIDSGTSLYQRGEALMRPIIQEVDASHGRRTKVAQLVQLNPVYTRDLMCKHCDYYKFDKRSGEWARMVAPMAINSARAQWRLEIPDHRRMHLDGDHAAGWFATH